jgi:transcription elongation factor Elf1
MSITVKEIVERIQGCKLQWTGWDWTHDFRCPTCNGIGKVAELGGKAEEDFFYLCPRCDGNGRIILEGPDESVPESVDYNNSVLDDAECTQNRGDDAIDDLTCGDLLGAVDHLEQACEIESQYGASPCWDQALNLINQFVEEVTCPECGELDPLWQTEPQGSWDCECGVGDGRINHEDE